MKYSYLILSLSLLIFSCKKENEYNGNEIHNIPYGEEGIMKEGDYSGDGSSTNTAGTKVTVEGTVTVDAMAISGTVFVPEDAVLVVNGDLHVGGGGRLDVHGMVVCKSFTQVGNSYISNGIVDVNGKLTVGGGTTLYLENSEVEVDELVITGHIHAIDNEITRAANYYSMIEMTGSRVLHRGGGTHICGPILLNTSVDGGSSGASLVDVTQEASANNSTIKDTYGLITSDRLYQYSDACVGDEVMPEH